MISFKDYLEKSEEIGNITSIVQSIVYVSGLPGLKLNELIITETEKSGIVHALNKESAEVLMFDISDLEIGERVTRTNETFKIPVNKNLLGRIINPLCQPIDGLGPISGDKTLLNIRNTAPSFTKRAKINKPLETGVTVVDLLIPIGCGQRELVIGDAKTGKTTLLLQTIINQAKRGTVCIYVAIDKKTSDTKSTEEHLKEEKGFNNTVMVVAPPGSPPPIGYLAPYVGMTIAEYFRDMGKNAIIILDDLTTHAKIYREISLLLKRAPGRTAYPGDIFHLHASLLERAGNIKSQDGKEISITAFPVAETLENDITGYIQTNLMAITDGHIFFDLDEFKKGRRPAINAFLSVSRVGNQTKEALDLSLSTWARKKLIESRRASEIAGFGVELPEETKKTIEIGEKLEVIFNQMPRAVRSREFQLFLFGLLLVGFWDDKPLKVMEEIIKEMIRQYKANAFSSIERRIQRVKTLDNLKNLAEESIPEIKNLILCLP